MDQAADHAADQVTEPLHLEVAPARGLLIAVEGPTGAGKTTLVERLRQWLDVTIALDPFEANPFLTDGRHGVVVELTFLGLRIDLLRHVEMELAAGRSVLADWSMAKQPIFASLTLDPADAARVAQACALWSGALPEPDLILHLRADTETLTQRIARRGRLMEIAIRPGELAALITAYDAALPPRRKLGEPAVLTADASTFDVFDDSQVADVAARIQQILPGLPSNPRPGRRATNQCSHDLAV